MKDRRNGRGRSPRTVAVFATATVALVFAFYLAVMADPSQQEGVEKPFAVEQEGESTEVDDSRQQVPADEAGEVEYETPSEWSETDFADSLEGTEIDGQLRADEEDRLIIDLAVRDLFDYFLNTADGVGPEAAIDRIEQLAESYLPDAAAEEAMVLLDQYLEYKERAVEIGNQPLANEQQQSPQYQAQMLAQGLEQMKQARRDVFPDAVVSAFFSKEEAYGDYTLARMEIEQREDLSRDERDQQIRLAQEQLPESMRRSEERMFEEQSQQREVARVMNEATSAEAAEEELRELGLPEDRVTAASERISQRQSFDSTYADYRQEKEALQEAGYAGSDHDQRVADLRKKYFEDEASRSRAEIRDVEGDSTAE